MRTKEREEWARVWAELLARPSGHVLRVPELRAAVRWWRAVAGGRVLMQSRLGDLRIAVVDVAGVDGSPVIIVGGPGALEVTQADEVVFSMLPIGRTITDPWGNILAVDSRRSAAVPR